MTARADYLRWRMQDAVGCVFARLIARRPDDYGQTVEEVPSAGTPAQIAARIAGRVTQLENKADVLAAALLLPRVQALEPLTRIALALGGHPRWLVSTSRLSGTPLGSVVAVHIVRDIDFQGGACPSEALVLGPFEEFPATRRAPVTALEVYIGHPLPEDPKTGRPTAKANLAHMDLPALTSSAIQAMWAKSIEGRLKSLGGAEDGRAKARISFVIPTSLANQLGCAP